MEENKKDVLILAIETSCDETAAAVVKNGRSFIKYHLYAYQTAYIIWRRSTGNCIQKTYRED